jgi:hypothetical protein
VTLITQYALLPAYILLVELPDPVIRIYGFCTVKENVAVAVALRLSVTLTV